MKLDVTKAVLGSLALAAAVSLAGEARAQAPESPMSYYQGYPCYSYFDTRSNGATGGMGNYGYVYVVLYTLPNCGGSGVGSAIFFCTTGATTPGCDPNWLQSETDLHLLMQNFHNAAMNGKKVTINWVNPAAFACGTSVTFWGN